MRGFLMPLMKNHERSTGIDRYTPRFADIMGTVGLMESDLEVMHRLRVDFNGAAFCHGTAVNGNLKPESDVDFTVIVPDRNFVPAVEALMGANGNIRVPASILEEIDYLSLKQMAECGRQVSIHPQRRGFRFNGMPYGRELRTHPKTNGGKSRYERVFYTKTGQVLVVDMVCPQQVIPVDDRYLYVNFTPQTGYFTPDVFGKRLHVQNGPVSHTGVMGFDVARIWQVDGVTGQTDVVEDRRDIAEILLEHHTLFGEGLELAKALTDTPLTEGDKEVYMDLVGSRIFRNIRELLGFTNLSIPEVIRIIHTGLVALAEARKREDGSLRMSSEDIGKVLDNLVVAVYDSMARNNS
jgi:hypothetical protein